MDTGQVTNHDVGVFSLAQIHSTFRGNIAAVRAGVRHSLPIAEDFDRRQGWHVDELNEQFFKRLMQERLPDESADDDDARKAKPVRFTPKGHEILAELSHRTSRHREQYGKPQAPLLRRGYLSLAVSAFESMFAQLIIRYYGMFPDELQQTQQTLTLRDLDLADDIEDAKKQVVLQEVEAVLRGSFLSHEKYFGKNLGVKLSVHNLLREDIVEIIQRRHLATHADMIVHKRYIKNVSARLVKKYSAKIDNLLTIDNSYLEDSLDCLHIYAALLLNACARAWFPEATTAELAGGVAGLQYSLLEKSRYEVAISLSDQAVRIHGIRDAQVKYMLLNKCTALRKLDPEADVVNLLNEHDWSSCSALLDLAHAIHSGDLSRAEDACSRAIDAGELRKFMMDDWEIFSFVREAEWWSKMIDKATRRSDSNDEA